MAVPVAAPVITGRYNSRNVARLTIPGVSDATSYKVYRDETASATTLLASGVSAGEYLDGTAYEEATYYYRVKATNGDGDSAGYSNEVVVTANSAGADSEVASLSLQDPDQTDALRLRMRRPF